MLIANRGPLRRACAAVTFATTALALGCPAEDDAGSVDAASTPSGRDGARADIGPDTRSDFRPDGGSQGDPCRGSTRPVVPEDPAVRGPWPVGARTVTVGRLTAEVFYPGRPGSEVGRPRVRYDLRKSLPASQQAGIPDQDNPWLNCDCYRDAPIDDAYGPFPVIFFAHGTAAFRTQSLTPLTHWASRGFVVVAADHPGLWLADTLALVCPDAPTGARDLAGDLASLIEAVRGAEPRIAFLKGRVDIDRIGLAGHSAGGVAVAQAAGVSRARVVIPMAGDSAPVAAPERVATLFLGALSDTVVTYSRTRAAYADAAPPKKLVGIASSGHLVFSDICEATNATGENLIQIAIKHGICGASLGGRLFDCNPDYIDAAIGNEIINYTTTAVLERALYCVEGVDLFAGIKERYPHVAEYLSDP